MISSTVIPASIVSGTFTTDISKGRHLTCSFSTALCAGAKKGHAASLDEPPTVSFRLRAVCKAEPKLAALRPHGSHSYGAYNRQGQNGRAAV